MGYNHTKIHSCITVNGDSAYLGNRMALQILTGTEMRELDVSAASSQSVDTRITMTWHHSIGVPDGRDRPGDVTIAGECVS